MVIYYVFFVLFYLFKIIQSKITIHVIPHNHQNIGRLNTFDEYYYKKAHDILTNSIESLLINNNRTFTYADISFFRQWYISLNETTKDHLHSLIKEGRFCFVNGGFGLESETLSHYNDVINELSIGLEFLQNELNIFTGIKTISCDLQTVLFLQKNKINQSKEIKSKNQQNEKQLSFPTDKMIEIRMIHEEMDIMESSIEINPTEIVNEIISSLCEITHRHSQF